MAGSDYRSSVVLVSKNVQKYRSPGVLKTAAGPKYRSSGVLVGQDSTQQGRLQVQIPRRAGDRGKQRLLCRSTGVFVCKHAQKHRPTGVLKTVAGPKHRSSVVQVSDETVHNKDAYMSRSRGVQPTVAGSECRSSGVLVNKTYPNTVFFILVDLGSLSRFTQEAM